MIPASDPERPPLLEARGLSVLRDDEPIFGPLSFALHDGQALVIEGDNGSGKTTLLRVLAGLMTASDGTVYWRGTALAAAGQEAGTIAFLGHHLGLKIELSPRDNLRFRYALGGLRAGISPDAALKSVGLEGFEDVPVRTLSAGQRKRTALASLLLGDAALWLLDEPYANLDGNGRVLVDRMVETHCRRGGAAVLSSHGLVQPAVSSARTLRLHA